MFVATLAANADERFSHIKTHMRRRSRDRRQIPRQSLVKPQQASNVDLGAVDDGAFANPSLASFKSPRWRQASVRALWILRHIAEGFTVAEGPLH
jgi:hypothetical protein